MNAATLTAPPRTPAGSTIAPGQMLTLRGVAWEQYVAIADALPDRPDLRISYDGDALEIMSTSQLHERWKRILNRIVEILTFEFDLPLQGGGCSTFRSEEIARGLEPDECYWIARADEVAGLEFWNPHDYPPPDLAIEIDVTSRSIDRQGIYARLGVPEVWRFDGATLRVLLRREDGEYEEVDESQCIPRLRVAELLPFLRASSSKDENEVARDILRWVRDLAE